MAIAFPKSYKANQMADDTKTKDDGEFSLTVPSGAPAYPKVIYVPREDGAKYPDGKPIMKEVYFKTVDDHKEWAKTNKGWNKDK